MSKTGKLYLIPHPLSVYKADLVNNQVKIQSKRIKYFIVEQLRTARRYLKAIDKSIDIDELTFFELNKHTNRKDIDRFIRPLLKGHDVGLMSEAGCPGVADPGDVVIKYAHRKNIKVVPLIGPNSILMALMSSGLNGQSFTFHGYLPRDVGELRRKLMEVEGLALKTGYAQIFMEAPYRNNKLRDTVLAVCKPETLFCIASNISGEKEFIKTQTIKSWRSNKPDLHKQPTIFILGK